MNNDASSKSWFERLSHAFSRPKNRDELLDWLEDATENQLLERDALQMMEGVLQVYDMQVRDVMIPRSQMVSVNYNASLEEILPIVISSAHSRFPVIKENLDEVMGILLAKDLLPFTVQEHEPFDMQKVLRAATFIPESKRLNLLLEEFRLSRNHMALVVDEYGVISGMVTIEDVLEEIVGEIKDEYDVNESPINISQINETQFTVNALTPIEEFNNFFHTHFTGTEFDTIGELVTHTFNYLPKRNETLILQGLEFKVLHVDKRKIRLLQVTTPFVSSETQT